MKLKIMGLTTVALVAGVWFWASADKNKSNTYMPDSVQCVTPTDSACTGAGRVGLRVPIGDVNLTGIANSLLGRCELEVDGESKPRPCTDVQLFLESEREGEKRTAVVDGFNFRFDKLGVQSQSSQQKFRISADSSQYLLAPQKMQTGQKPNQLNIKLKARPKK